MESPQKLLTIAHLAELAGQSRRTIERRIAEGVLPVVHPGGGRDVRIRPSDAARYLDGQPPADLGRMDATVHPIRKEST